jgi:hypothetical protein
MVSMAVGRGNRLARLEDDVAELKQLSLRVAELTDVVGELLVELARVDPERAGEILDRYQRELGS